MSVIVHPDGRVAITPTLGTCYRITIVKQQSNIVDVSVSAQEMSKPHSAQRSRKRPKRVTVSQSAPMTMRGLDIELLEYMAVAPRGGDQLAELQKLAEHDADARAALGRVNLILAAR